MAGKWHSITQLLVTGLMGHWSDARQVTNPIPNLISGLIVPVTCQTCDLSPCWRLRVRVRPQSGPMW